MVWRYNNPMRKNKLIIKLLFPFIAMILSSCAASNASRYSYGDRSSFSYRPTSNDIDNPNDYAKGKRIFDAFYDNAVYESDYAHREYSLYIDEFNNIPFRVDSNGLYKVTLDINGSELNITDIGAIYVADINFDGHKDLCIGKRVSSGRDYYTAYAYDIHNSKELVALSEMDKTYSGGHDYVYNIKDDLLVVESSYNVNPISINSIGYFKKNAAKEVELDWHKIQFEIIDFEEDFSGLRKFKGTDGVERYIVQTDKEYEELYIYVNFIGDFSTSTYTEEDLSLTESSGYDSAITHKFIDNVVLSLKFNSEGRYDITFRVGRQHSITLHFEANNELYEMLQVA